MKRHFLFLFIALIVVNTSQAQTRGTKIGYIDMEYILQNVPSYNEAQSQLEQKAQKWKQEVESKKIEINKLKEDLKAEKALLTKGLIEERETEIKFLENEMLDYQQKRFGPNGDLMIQKSLLTKPIQDQVFTAVQDISEAKKYDFIFDKTSDMTMLFAAKRFDISDQVLRVITRADKREQLTKKQLKEEEAKENKEDEDNNPAAANRKKILEDRKAARDKIIADRKAQQEERKKANEDRLSNRGLNKTASTVTYDKTDPTAANLEKERAKTAAAEAKQKQADTRAQVLEDRKKIIEDNKKAAADKRQQIIEEREAKKAIKLSTVSKKTDTVNDSEKEASKTAAAAAVKKQADARAKVIEDRKKVIEDNKKAANEKRQQILDERAAKKSSANSTSTKTTEIVNSIDKEAAKTTADDAKQKQIEERDKVVEGRKKAIEDAKKAADEKRKQILEEKQAKKTGTISEPTKKEEIQIPKINSETNQESVKPSREDIKQTQTDLRAKTIEDRKKAIEDRKKIVEEKRKKILEEREAKTKKDTLK